MSNFPEELNQVGLMSLQRHLASFQFTEIQKLVDQSQKALAISHHDSKHSLLVVIVCFVV